MVGENFPKNMRIGAYDFSIHWMDRAEEETSGEMGLADVNNQIIRCSSSRQPQMIGSTLLHEIIHCCHTIGGAYEDGLTEEKYTSACAEVLAQVMRDNLHVIDFITDCLTRENNPPELEGLE